MRRPRVLIGGTGEKQTLWLVAQYADACNVFDIPDGGRTVRRKLDVLARRSCSPDRKRWDRIHAACVLLESAGFTLSRRRFWR